jgi:RNA-binding protein
MNESTEPALVLSSGQKKTLRGKGHHLDPIVLVGKEGLTPALLKSTQTALKAHELIKIKLGPNCPLERNEAASELARCTEATLVQLIGRMVVMYRPNPDLPNEKRVATGK